MTGRVFHAFEVDAMGYRGVVIVTKDCEGRMRWSEGFEDSIPSTEHVLGHGLECDFSGSGTFVVFTRQTKL